MAFQAQSFIKVTFWGVEFFKSQEGVEVEFGTELRWRIFRQLSSAQAEQIDGMYRVVSGVLSTVLVVVTLFVGIGGRMLPVWMFLNSLQLVAHLPLVATDMPANLHYILIKHLDLVRLRI